MAIARMIVVGLDGATFNLIKPWVAEGKLPTFARLLAEEIFADVRFHQAAQLRTNQPDRAVHSPVPHQHHIMFFKQPIGRRPG